METTMINPNMAALQHLLRLAYRLRELDTQATAALEYVLGAGDPNHYEGSCLDDAGQVDAAGTYID
jgi:hypothetical protein